MTMNQRPSRPLTLMEVAELYAKRSTCSRAHVGVVIAHEGRILSTGYNGSPAGITRDAELRFMRRQTLLLSLRNMAYVYLTLSYILHLALVFLVLS